MFTDTGTARANTPHAPATGPKTDHGRRISARNATTHGLFARDVVLTHLGEDPEGYRALLHELTQQLQPKNMLEQHYVEKIAAASWRLRRLQRWQAQLFEDPDITEDEALNKLDRVMRHETALHRQIDTSVKMLGRELPKLFQDRVRAELIRDMNATEKDCREDPAMNEWITAQTRRRIPSCPVPPALDPATLDAAPPTTTNCQNEPAPSPVSPGTALADPEGGEVARNEPEGVLSPAERAWIGVPPEIVRLWTAGDHTHTRPFCQNEPVASALTPPELGAGGRSGADRARLGVRPLCGTIGTPRPHPKDRPCPPSDSCTSPTSTSASRTTDASTPPPA